MRFHGGNGVVASRNQLRSAMEGLSKQQAEQVGNCMLGLATIDDGFWSGADARSWSRVPGLRAGLGPASPLRGAVCDAAKLGYVAELVGLDCLWSRRWRAHVWELACSSCLHCEEWNGWFLHLLPPRPS